MKHPYELGRGGEGKGASVVDEGVRGTEGGGEALQEGGGDELVGGEFKRGIIGQGTLGR